MNKFILILIFIAISLAAVVFTLAAVDSTACSREAQHRNVSAEYRFLDGCYTHTSDGWIKISAERRK